MSSSPDLEKGQSSLPQDGPNQARHEHHLHLGGHHIPHHPGRRLKQFIRPNGRQVHVAHTPEEEHKLRRHLSTAQAAEEFDIYLHGSPEHLEAIRELHAHQEYRRDNLREQHGGVYEEIERVKMDLDALSTELNLLTEHGVSLDANFSKFGYSAHLRTKDFENNSAATSVNGERSSDRESRNWDEERKRGSALVFWRRPVIRQYFHKGLLWRASETTEVGSFELFVDLLYVGIIGVIGDGAAEHASGDSFHKFSIVFIIGWAIWRHISLVVSWFESDDIFQRFCVMFIVICLFGYTTNIVYAFDTTYTSLIAFYLCQRLFAVVYFIFVAWILPMVRGTMLSHAAIILISAALWIGSIHVDLPGRYALIWIALCVDMFGHAPIAMIMRNSQRSNCGWLMNKLTKYFEFYPAVNIEHRTERTNAFVTLVFGASVLAIIYQSRAAYGINAFFGKAILGLIQAYTFNWIYFEIDGYNLHVHAIRRHAISSFIWMIGHLPFIMGYVLASASMSHLVLAHDCSDVDPETLGEGFAERSEEHLSDGLRWFYCGGIGVALFCMSLISVSHVHKKIPNQRVPKLPRIIFRFLVSIAIILLPLSHRLTSLSLLGTTTALVTLVLWIELYGNSYVGDGFFTDGFWKNKERKYHYNAECSVWRKTLREKVKKGERVTIEDLAVQDADQRTNGTEHL